MCAYIINSVICCISFCFIKICNSPWHGIVRFFLDVWCYTIPSIIYSIPHHFSFTWNMVTNHFLYYVLKVLYGVHVWRIPRPFQNRYSFTFYGCSTTFRVMEWREIMHTDIALLLEHSAKSFQYHEFDDIEMTLRCVPQNNITLVFRITHVTIHFSQSFSLLLIAPQTCTLTGDFTVV